MSRRHFPQSFLAFYCVFVNVWVIQIEDSLSLTLLKIENLFLTSFFICLLIVFRFGFYWNWVSVGRRSEWKRRSVRVAWLKIEFQSQNVFRLRAREMISSSVKNRIDFGSITTTEIHGNGLIGRDANGRTWFRSSSDRRLFMENKW